MEEKNADKENIGKILDFLKVAGKLKFTYRFGASNWKEKESSAAHSWRSALMVILFAEELNIDVDILKSIKLALVHDLPEAIVGDTDFRYMNDGKETQENKTKKEEKAMKIFNEMLPKEQGKEMYDLWVEYEEAKTKEARFIKALEKAEGMAFLSELGKDYYDDRLDIIPKYMKKPYNFCSEIDPLSDEIKKRLKEEFKKGKFEWRE